MDFILSRYRNLTVLVAAILAQLLLLAYQVRSNGEVRLIRVWAVSAVTPLARLLEGSRSGASDFFSNYLVLVGVRQENKRMQTEMDRLRMENQYLKTELSTADRAKALALFEQNTPGKYVAARIISNTTSSGAMVVIIDRGTSSGIQKGMAVRTPEGIVGKVISVFPTASFVRLVTDAASAAGVISGRNNVHGTLVGMGRSTAAVNHIPNERSIEPGEWFYTAGDDLVFPRGVPVGQVISVRNGTAEKEIVIQPSALRQGLEDVLVVIEGVHLPVPAAPPDTQPVHVQAAPAEPPAPPPAAAGSLPALGVSANDHMLTDADRMVEQYRKLGESQNHAYGAVGSKPPNFNPAPAQPTTQAPQATPAPKP
jgi:rod shape-determining protein MreC